MELIKYAALVRDTVGKAFGKHRKVTFVQPCGECDLTGRTGWRCPACEAYHRQQLSEEEQKNLNALDIRPLATLDEPGTPAPRR